jgi:hypothetical protein
MKDMLPNRIMNLRALRGHREHSAEQNHEGHVARQDHQAGRLESGLHRRSFNAKRPAKLHRPQGHTRKDRTTPAASISGAMAVQLGPSSLLHTVRALFTAAQNSQGAIGFERAPAPLLHTMRAFFTVAWNTGRGNRSGHIAPIRRPACQQQCQLCRGVAATPNTPAFTSIISSHPTVLHDHPLDNTPDANSRSPIATSIITVQVIAPFFSCLILGSRI